MLKVIALLLCCLGIGSAHTKESAKQKGLRIANIIYKASRGAIGGSDVLSLELFDGKGGRIIRDLISSFKEVKGDGDKSLIIFKRPLDIKGTKLLTWAHKNKNDDQWLYLPSFKRVKRISNRGKSASFMGSEFSYEDLITPEVSKYNFKFLKEYKGKKSQKLWVVERTSKKSSSYSKVIWTYSQKMRAAIHAEYYDRRGELLKKSDFKKFKVLNVKNKKFYMPYIITMKNRQTAKSSQFKFNKRKLGINHSDRIFNKNKLK